MQDTLTLADIVGAYGIKGWVKLRVRLEQPELLRSLQSLQLVRPSHQKIQHLGPVSLQSLQQQGKGFVAQLSDVEDRTAAEALKGCEIRIDASLFPQAGEDEIYWRDLVGMQVLCEEQGETVLLGTVSSLLETGANDVLVVSPCEGSVDTREHLVPWIPGDVVLEVSQESSCIRVAWFADA